MPKPLLLRLHRWAALTFALPLAAVILSGLFLAFEPALKARTPDGTVTLERLEAVLAAAGPQAERAALFIRGYDGTASIGRGAAYDLATGAAVEAGALAGAFRTARQLHERLLLDLGWLVTASTIALLAMTIPGLLLGLPRLRNTVAGWHRVSAWAVLPLLVGSPLTGLALAFGITFTTPVPRAPGQMPPMMDTLRAVAERHDLDGLDFVRPAGAARLVRVLDASGTAVAYRMTTEGLQPTASNWPRILHEGNWGGLLGSIANIVASVVLAGLLGTGVWIWAKRSLAKRAGRRRRAALSRQEA
jgi:uncharacterized iron-regulated membrane protein